MGICAGNKQTTAGAPMPLRPPTPSVRTLRVYSQAGLNCFLAVHGLRLSSLENTCSFVQARETALFQFRSLLLYGLCHVLLHRPAGRRTWARNTPSEYQRTAIFCNHAISAVCQALFYSDIWIIVILTVLSAWIIRCFLDYRNSNRTCSWDYTVFFGLS